MFKNLEVFQLAYGMARHAGARQAVTATNIANADTPGYRARDVQAFSEIYGASAAHDPMRATRSQHLNGYTNELRAARTVDSPGPSSPNGNTVSLETEMVRGVEAKREHDRALAIYKASLDLLRSSLGRR